MTSRSARSRRSGRNRAIAAGPRTARRRRWWRWWFALLVLPGTALAAVGLLAFFFVFSSVPLPDDIEARSSVVFDVAGNEVGGLAADLSREDVVLAALPDHVPQAVLGVEDRNFYEHRGVSATGIARALFTNVRAGGIQQGGSTISMQYIKNAALTPEQTYRRKVQEVALALKLEQAYSKDEILEFYLNTAYWGRGATGIEAAARTYFDKTAADLTVNEAATLAGMLASPENLDPLDNPDRADTRRRVSLTGMLEKGWISQGEHDRVVAEGLPQAVERRGADLGPNSYYLDAVRRVLGQIPDFEGGELYRGLRIHTHLDQRLQAAAQDTLARAVADGPTDTGAIVTVDPWTGGVRALVGGPDAVDQPLNTALVSDRQVGSTLKAFTLQAFIEDGWSPRSRFPAPATIEVGDAEIRNFGGAAFGEQTVEQATASSTNTVFVQMQEHVGRELVIDAARRAGLPRDKREEPFATQRRDGPVLNDFAGLTLGQDGFTALEMASAFGTFATEGVHVTPHFITRVEDRNGTVIWEPDIDEAQAVDINVARTVTDGLVRAVESGSGRAAALDRPVSGKTGTTNEGRDVWFVGFVPQLATSVWLGNLDNSPILVDEGSATGGGLAAPVWAAYMSQAVEGMDVVDFAPPDLSDLQMLNAEPEACPTGYEFAAPPSEADEDGFFPDILTDITDERGRPCVQVKPEPEPEDETDPEEEAEPEPEPEPEPAPEPVPDPGPGPSPGPGPGPGPVEPPVEPPTDEDDDGDEGDQEAP